MRKTIRILSICAVAAAVLYLLAYFFVFIFQVPLKEAIGVPDIYISYRYIPVIGLINSLRVVLVTALLCIFAGSHKIGIWAELVLLGINQLLWPPVYTVLVSVESAFYSRVGEVMLASRSYFFTITNWFSFLLGAATVLFASVCGMSIAYKVMNKKCLRLEAAQSAEQSVSPQA